MTRTVDVVVVGAGPAGLTAATRLRERGVARVLVVERESVAGGVPRHCVHPGFGVRDLHRFLSGPRYAEELVRRALAQGVEVATSTTVIDVDARGVDITSARGVERVDAQRVLVATGARERPRAARWIAGDRPAGVFTTGQLQQWTYLERLPVGRRALVVGAEHVSFSAIMTLRHAGVTVVGLATELERHQSVAGASLAARYLAGAPVWHHSRVVDLEGRGRLSAVTLEDVRDGRQRRLAVDTVVFTGDWIPDHELVRRAGVEMDVGTRGPASDEAGRTSVAGIYAAGNLLHPVESADVAALGARVVADALAAELARPLPATRDVVRLTCDDPLSWVWPNRLLDGAPVDLLRLRTRTFTDATRLQLLDDSHRLVVEGPIRRTTPHRSLLAAPAVVRAIGHGARHVRLA